MLPPTGFWSYTTTDETGARGKLSQLRALLAAELQQQIGRFPKVNIFQDVVAIPPGRRWETQIREAIEESSFIIPIVTPGFLQSEWCCQEVALFREREERVGVKDLIFPIHYVDVGHIDGTKPHECHDASVLQFLLTHQWIDFRHLRLRNPDNEEVSVFLETTAAGILRALRKGAADLERAAVQREAEGLPTIAAPADDRRPVAIPVADTLIDAPTPPRPEEAAATPIATASLATASLAAANQQSGSATPRRAPVMAIVAGLIVGIVAVGASAVLFFPRKPDPTAMGQQAASEPTIPQPAPLPIQRVAPQTAAPQTASRPAPRSTPNTTPASMPTPTAPISDEHAAAGGDTAAMNRLGLAYETGRGVTQNYATARQWYEKAAAAGNLYAMNEIGFLLKSGLGGPRDFLVARQWFEKAAAGGEDHAMTNLGYMYLLGRGFPQDPTAALQWFEKAAAAGNGGAMNEIGIIHRNGRIVPRDYGAARFWFEKAAATGEPHAMTNLGNLYLSGLGVPQDETAARRWFERGAAAGNLGSMNDLGMMYKGGRGVPQDYATARQWFEKAAAGGDPRAMNNLAFLYENGLGVPRDEMKGREWRERATGLARTLTSQQP